MKTFMQFKQEVSQTIEEVAAPRLDKTFRNASALSAVLKKIIQQANGVTDTLSNQSGIFDGGHLHAAKQVMKMAKNLEKVIPLAKRVEKENQKK